jgi:hypothetical protein
LDGGSGFPSLKANGEVSGWLLVYDRVFTGDEEFDIESLGDISGRLDVSLLSPYLDGFLKLRFDTNRLLLVDEAYARFTMWVFEADLGFQYYTGHFCRPVFSTIIGLISPQLDFNFGYTRYHQIGVDYTQVLLGFNVRSELGISLTPDLDGDDPAVENPAIVYSLDFDRDLFWGDQF